MKINNYSAKIAFLSFIFVSVMAVSSTNAFAKVREGKPNAKATVPTKYAKTSRAEKRSDVTLKRARAIALKRAPGKVES